MTNKDFFKKIGKSKTKSKKTVDGYYFDGKKSFTLYKDESGKATMKSRRKK
jgi:hypothetical protein